MRKLLVLASLLAAGVIGAQAPALAQVKAPIYRYCLQQNGGWQGVSMTLCRYNTMEQCWASRIGPADLCYLNPEFRQSRK